MLYINVSKKRKLIGVRRIKKWVEPRQIVDLDKVDIRMLGVNGASMMLKDDFVKIKKATRKRRQKIRIKRARKAAAKTKAQEKKAPKEVTKKVLKKKKAPTAAQLKVQRTKLKEAIGKKNKMDLIAFGEDVLGMKIKRSDKKDAIILKVLNAAKGVGYAKILKKA